MKKLARETFEIIKEQIYHRATDVDVAMFGIKFDNFNQNSIVDALTLYQNNDGGFGHGLEYDNLNPNSSVIQVSTALELIKECDFTITSKYPPFHKMISGIFEYLYINNPPIDHKWCSRSITNNDYPCASWWKYHKEDPITYNPTASLIGYTLYYTNQNSSYYLQALTMLEPCLNSFLNLEYCNDKHLIKVYHQLYDILVALQIANEYHQPLRDQIVKFGLELIVNSLGKWDQPYPDMPIDIFYNKSIINPQISEYIELNLDYLITELPNHYMWEINWEWYNDYPEFVTSSLKWMGRLTVNNLIILTRFNRIS